MSSSPPGAGHAAAGRAAAAADVGAAARRIQVAGTFNLRDLGGYPAGAGRTTRWRTLLRSDALHLADANGIAVLAGYGLRTVIDLRSRPEADNAVSVAGIAARTVRVPLLGEDLQELPPRLDAIYQYLIEQRGDVIAAAIGHLCEAGSVPALVHCSAGKDRTGVLVGLILAALGVRDEIIGADYALSASYLSPYDTAAIGQLRASSGLGDRLTAELLASPAELLLDVLSQVRAAAGSVDGYLLSHGLTQHQLDSLRRALTE